MIYDVKLTIGYEFDLPTQAVTQILRLRPRDVPGMQKVLTTDLKLSPSPLAQTQRRDFFGNLSDDITLPAGHTRFDYTLTAQVDRLSRGRVLDITPPVSRLTEELRTARDVGRSSPLHFIAPSPLLGAVPEIADYARNLVGADDSIRQIVKALGLALHEDMSFDPNATFVDTPPEVAFAQKSGVCQDFTHIMIVALRALGIPAGYVSGFLRTDPPEGQARLAGSDAMHAWVRAWGGIERGWLEFDPTNAVFAGSDHIVIGYGRDYSDVAPVKGVLRFTGGQRTFHAVDVVEAVR